MLAGFPRLGSGVAVANTALTAVAAVASAGYVASPEATSEKVAKWESKAVITFALRPPTGAQRGALRAWISSFVH